MKYRIRNILKDFVALVLIVVITGGVVILIYGTL